MTNIKFIILALLLVGAGVLAYYVLGHLSDETVMALVGVMCGIIASIPLSVLLLVTLTRDRSAYVTAPAETEIVSASASGWTVIEPEPQTIDAPMRRQLNRGGERDTP